MIRGWEKDQKRIASLKPQRTLPIWKVSRRTGWGRFVDDWVRRGNKTSSTRRSNDWRKWNRLGWDNVLAWPWRNSGMAHKTLSSPTTDNKIVAELLTVETGTQCGIIRSQIAITQYWLCMTTQYMSTVWHNVRRRGYTTHVWPFLTFSCVDHTSLHKRTTAFTPTDTGCELLTTSYRIYYI